LATVFILSTTLASAIPNPAAVYCSSLGYEYEGEQTEEGVVGYCRLPNAERVDAWGFLRGEAALNHSYCALEGYPAKHVTDPDICESCTVCVLPNRTEIKVTELMNLGFKEATCGDGVCTQDETPETCPQDCQEEMEIPKNAASNWKIMLAAAGVVTALLAIFLLILLILVKK